MQILANHAKCKQFLRSPSNSWKAIETFANLGKCYGRKFEGVLTLPLLCDVGGPAISVNMEISVKVPRGVKNRVPEHVSPTAEKDTKQFDSEFKSRGHFFQSWPILLFSRTVFFTAAHQLIHESHKAMQLTTKSLSGNRRIRGKGQTNKQHDCKRNLSTSWTECTYCYNQ